MFLNKITSFFNDDISANFAFDLFFARINTLLNEHIPIHKFSFFFFFFFLSGFSFTTIHDSKDSRRREEGISLTPHYPFHPLHRQLVISRAITAESSPLHIGRSRTRTGNLWFPSASRQPLSYAL